MKKVYIILSQSGTFISKALKFFSHDEFNHSSICIDDSFERFYSFGRLKINNPLCGGFLIENAFTHVFGKFKEIPCMILELAVTDEQFDIIEKTLDGFIAQSLLSINMILRMLFWQKLLFLLSMEINIFAQNSLVMCLNKLVSSHLMF